MRGLADSGARWNVLAQQIFFARLDYQGGDEQRFTMDAWDGYADSHDRIVDFVARRGVDNPSSLRETFTPTGQTRS